MITYEDFISSVEAGEIDQFNFSYEGEEYAIARQDKEGKAYFTFCGEKNATGTGDYESLAALLDAAAISSHPIKELWKSLRPLEDSTQLDDYVKINYHELGKVIDKATGTVEIKDNYLTQRLLPALAIMLIILGGMLVLCILIPSFTWEFFAYVVAIVVVAGAIAQVPYFGDGRKFRGENPDCVFFVLEEGAVLFAYGYEFIFYYDKIHRISAEAGLYLVTLHRLYLFTPNRNESMKETFVQKVKASKEKA